MSINLSLPQFSPPTSSFNHWSTVCFYELVILDISYRQNHISCGLLCLVPLTWHNIVKVHPCCCMYQLHSLLGLNNIPLCEYTILCLSIHQLIDIRVVATFWLLLVVLLWTSVHKFFVSTSIFISPGGVMSLFVCVRVCVHMYTHTHIHRYRYRHRYCWVIC